MPFPSTPILDNCTRPNEDPLSDGGLWTGLIFSTDASLRLVSNAITTPAAVGNASRAWGATFGADQEVYATLGTTDRYDFYYRLTNPGTATPTSYDAIVESGTAGVDLYKNVAGVFTFLHTFPVSARAAGDVFGINVVGTTHTAFRNGVSLGTFTDAAVSGAGQVGVNIHTVTDSLTAFGGGTMPLPADHMLSSCFAGH